jgi:mannose-6-phosphate isomerase-like protein (cupin superfamily)
MTRKVVVLVAYFLLNSASTVPQATNNAQPAAKIEVENQRVRVVRHYHRAHEKVAMHSHPDSVVVYLTEVHELSTEQDGKERQVTHHAGDVIWSPAHTHSLVNLADTPIETIEIELQPACGACR